MEGEEKAKLSIDLLEGRQENPRVPSEHTVTPQLSWGRASSSILFSGTSGVVLRFSDFSAADDETEGILIYPKFHQIKSTKSKFVRWERDCLNPPKDYAEILKARGVRGFLDASSRLCLGFLN